VQIASPLISGVTDISAPVLRGEFAAAALTVPFLARRQPVHTARDVAAMVVNAAGQIAGQLVRRLSLHLGAARPRFVYIITDESL
jgi:DNA-binding IclR family transcriptional regulator